MLCTHSPGITEFTVHRQIKIRSNQSLEAGQSPEQAMEVGLEAEPTAAALAVRCSGPSQKRDSNLQKKKPRSTSFSITPSSAQKDMSDKQMKHVKWLSSSLVQLMTKIYEASYESFWTLLVAAKPAKPSRFQLLSFGVW